MTPIKVKKLAHFDDSLGLPFYKTEGASGADLKSCLPNRDTLTILPGQRVLVPTGLAFEIPPSFELQVRPRSGLSLTTGLLVVNSPGTIDEDYRGELQVILGNLGEGEELIRHGDRIAQLVLSPVVRGTFEWAATLSSTRRGEEGFGSTGRA